MAEGTKLAPAITQVLAEEMRRDDSVVLFGEDVADAGGVFKVTAGLLDEFGHERVRDTPISETAMAGMALGAAITGLRPVLEIMFADFLAVAFDQIANQIAKYRYHTGEQVSVPLVVRCASGAGLSFASQHSQSPEGWLLQVPGLKIVVPSRASDAAGLLRAAIRDDDPVIFLEHKALYWERDETPIPHDPIPLGSATVRLDGSDATIVAAGAMVAVALEAADELRRDEISATVVDLRTVVPLDRAAVRKSLGITGRLITVEESPGGVGWSSDLVAWSVEEGLVEGGRARRVNPPPTPIPYAPNLERAWLPDASDVVSAAKELFT